MEVNLVKRSASSTCKCFFHGFDTKFNDSESSEEFQTHVTNLMREVWIASYTRSMTPCIVQAVRDCIEACKRTKLSTGRLAEFFDFRLGGKTVPTWIIFHSPSDDLVKVSTRHLLLQMYLDELPLTPAIRDELYVACATKGFNNFFARVRLASLKQLQVPSVIQMEKGGSLKPPSGLQETVTVVPALCGFKLKWFVPDMLQRLQSGLVIGTEFVAKGQVWGMYIQALTDGEQVGRWRIILCALKPSRINLEGTDFVVSFKVSPCDRRKIFGMGSKMIVLFSNFIGTLDLPVQGDIPPNDHLRWLLARDNVEQCHRYINKDGSCHLTVAVAARSLFSLPQSPVLLPIIG